MFYIIFINCEFLLSELVLYLSFIIIFLNKVNNIFCNKNINSSKNIDNSIKNKKREIEKSLIVNRININKFYIYFCFCYVRKMNNIESILLNEGMRLFIEKMDILTLFKKMIINDTYKTNSLNKNSHLIKII